jgi:catechol 2,3-dioxygenase-like lactoylglutathione lyase family enzyme
MSTDTASWAKSIFAITIFTEDLNASKHFYQNIFGLALVFEDPNSAVFKIGETMINVLDIKAANELVEPAKIADRDSGSRYVFTVQVDDVDAICANLTSRGVTLINGPMDRPWGVRTASFSDPGGHIWEIAK